MVYLDSAFGLIAYLIASAYHPDFEMNTLNHALVLIGLLLATNFKAFFYDKQFNIKPVYAGLTIAVILILNFLDIKGYLPLGDYFEWFYSFLITNTGTALIPILGMTAAYLMSFSALKKVAYLEDGGAQSSITGIQVKSGIFSRFGEAGDLMEMETKLIVRNRRSRNLALMMLLMLVYPLIISNGSTNSMVMKIFTAIFCTGGFALSYGQLLLSWNSDHFDVLLTRMTSIKEIFKAKYYLQSIIVIVQGSLMTLWGFYDSVYFLLMPVMILYNLGIVLFLYMYLASYNSKKIDTTKGASMNYEGVSVSLFLIIIPLMGLPLLSYYAFAFWGQANLGLVIIGLIGVVGFIFHDKLLDGAVRLFIDNKYKIGGAFRAK